MLNQNLVEDTISMSMKKFTFFENSNIQVLAPDEKNSNVKIDQTKFEDLSNIQTFENSNIQTK